MINVEYGPLLQILTPICYNLHPFLWVVYSVHRDFCNEKLHWIYLKKVFPIRVDKKQLFIYTYLNCKIVLIKDFLVLANVNVWYFIPVEWTDYICLL